MVPAPSTIWGAGYIPGRDGEEEGGGCSRAGLYHRQMLCGPAQLEEARDVAALRGVFLTPLGF